MRPTTAVILAAGVGTRMLPVTSAVQKELLPIGNRPVIDYIVSDLVAAGINRVIFVIRPGQTGLKNYFLGDPEIESTLRRLGKTQALEDLDRIHHQAAFEFVEQPPAEGYGTAPALETALYLLGPQETILVCSSDDFVWHADGTSETAKFLDTFEHSGGEGAIMTLKQPDNLLHQYGVLEVRSEHGHQYLSRIVEKPAPGAAPSNLANVSSYVLNDPLRQYIKTVEPHPDTGERYITDAVSQAASDHAIIVHVASGTYIDTGTPESWLAANQLITGAKS